MSEKGTNVYEVKLTALRRRREDGGGAPDMSKRWTFVQLQRNATTPQDALQKMLRRFFELHPHDTVLLPKGKGFKELTSHKGAQGFLSDLKSEDGSFRLGNDLASLNVVLMPAMSGERPSGLPTPKSDEEYSKRLQQNFEVGPAFETLLVQMPSPIKGNTMSTIEPITYKGHLYRPVVISASPSVGLKKALMEQMDVVVATTELYLQNKVSVDVLDGTLRLASLISDRLTAVASFGIVTAAELAQKVAGVQDTDVLMKIQRIKDELKMRHNDKKLADVLRSIGTAKSANDAVIAMKRLLEVSPALNGAEGAPASLAVVNATVGDESLPWLVYVKRPDWEGGATYIYDALTHSAFYDVLDDEFFSRAEQRLDDMLQEAVEEEPPVEEEEAPKEPERLWA